MYVVEMVKLSGCISIPHTGSMAVFDSFLIFSIFSAPFVGHPFQPLGVGTGGNPLRVSESVCGFRL